MPISARELFLIIRAKNEASRVLTGLAREFQTVGAAQAIAAQRTLTAGAALTSVGAGIALVGAMGIKFLAGATQASVAYTKTAAITKTQIDGLKVSTRGLEDMGLRVAKSIGVPLEQMQPALYDIFSSLDVSIPQSERLLKAFAKTAVAGNVDMATAGRATIAILNAFNVPIDDVNKVLDFQFQLVRKGVGTYQQFATTIGRAIPSAARAGQTYETLGGMLAYMTRNGLSAAMAASSSARALDAVSHPKTVQKLQKMGITVKNAAGEFRPMTSIIKQLQKELADLTKPERADALYKLFKSSGGTIQARRFFDLVLSGKKEVQDFTKFVKYMESATGDFSGKQRDANNKINQMTREMKGAGPAQQAYTTVAQTMAIRQQLLQNRWQAARIELGRNFIPVLEQLMSKLEEAMNWWDRQSDATKRSIAQWAGITAVALTVIGILTAVAGVIIMLKGAMMLMGGSTTMLLTKFGLIIVAGYLLKKVWDESHAAAIGLAAGLTALLVINKLRTAFAGFGGVVGNTRAGLQLYSGAVANGTSKTSAFSQTLGAGFTGSMSKFRGSLSRGMAMVGGPWGLAIAGGIAAVGFFMAKHHAAVARIDAMRDALDKETGAITNNARELTKKTLLESGALAAGRALGVNLKDLVDASLGNEQSMKRVNAQLAVNKDRMGQVTHAIGVKVGGNQSLSASERKVRENMSKVTGAIGDQKGELAKAREEWGLMAEAGSNVANQMPGIGEAVGNGFAAGIRLSTDNAVQAAVDMSAKVAAASRRSLKEQSPSKVFEQIGKWVGQGFINGLLGIQPELGEVAQRVFGGIEDTLGKLDTAVGDKHKKLRDRLRGMVLDVKTHLGKIAKHIDELNVQIDASNGILEQLMQARKAFTVDGFVGSLISIDNGLSETQNKVKEQIGTIVNNIDDIFGKAQPKLRKRLQAIVQDQRKALMSLAADWDRYNAQLTDANATLSQLSQERQQLFDSVQGIVSGGGNLSTLTGPTKAQQKQIDDMQTAIDAAKEAATALQGANKTSADASVKKMENDLSAFKAATETFSGGQMITVLNDRVAAASAFASNLMTLQSQGLNAQALAELAQAGVDQGGAAAQALVDAGGTMVTQMNASQAVLNGIAAQTASLVANTMYNGGIAQAQAVVDGLNSKMSAIQAQMEAIAATLSNTYQIGVDVVGGIVKGLNDAKGDLFALMRRIARRLVRELRKEIGANSPATKFALVGKDAILGAVQGVHRTAPRLYREMAAVGTNMTMAPRMTMAGSSRPVDPAASGTGLNMPISITTQEIDPRKHAADLGWEIAKRVG